MKISFIGSGNVAWHLSQALEDKGYLICEVYSRHLSNSKALVKQLFDVKAVDSLDFSESEAELFVLAVSDDSIQRVLDQLELPENAVLVHTSGSKSLELLTNWNLNIAELNIKVGVFYPLMSFTKERKIQFSDVPLCIECEDKTIETLLVKTAQKISNIVYLVDTEERKILHLAAVFANNFVNHLLAISQDILNNNDLEMNLLRPIIKETVLKAINAVDIHDMQTGPAKRGDQKTINNQIDLLKPNPMAEKIYKIMTESIYSEFNL